MTARLYDMYIPGEGPVGGSRIMLVGEYPDNASCEYKVPFAGQVGEIVEELCREAGFRFEETYRTYIVKHPLTSEFKNTPDLQQQINNFWLEVEHVKPNCIVAFGNDSLFACTGKSGILNYRGSILTGQRNNVKVIATLDPANLVWQRSAKGKAGLFKYAWKYVMIADMKRVFEQSKYPEIKLPYRNLKVMHSSLELYRYLREYDGCGIATSDIESINCLPVCAGIAFNKSEAVSVPLYRKFGGITFTDMSVSEVAECWKLLAKFYNEKKIIGHNFKYDDEKLFRLGLRNYSGSIYADTLSLEHTLCPELPSKKLNVVSSIRTLEPFYKDEGSEFHPSKDSTDRLLLYNAKDCAVTYEVWEDQDAELKELADTVSPKIYNFYYDYVAQLHNFYLEMERIGIRVDKHIRHRLDQKYTAWHNRIQKRFLERNGKLVNVFAHAKINDFIYGELNIPFRKNASEDTLVQLMTNSLKDELRINTLSDILEDRRVRKANSTYIHASLDYDDRLRTSYFITGTETGRSTSNLLENPIRPKKHSVGLAFQTITKHGDIGSDVRKMLVPDYGYVFLSCDLSQAEARIVAVLCQDWELLKAFDTIDIHRRTAGLVFDYVSSIELTKTCSNPLVDKLGKDSGERFLGKKTRHAGNYNMGPERHHADAHSEARRAGIKLDLSEYKARRNLEKFHECSPKIRGVFHRDIQHFISSRRFLVNPYGRFRLFMDRFGEEMFREAYAFIPQSTVHDTLTLGCIRIKKEIPELRFVQECHDSITVLAPKERVGEIARVIKKHIEIPIDFTSCTIKRDIQLVIPADFEVSETNMKESKKLKVS